MKKHTCIAVVGAMLSACGVGVEPEAPSRSPTEQAPEVTQVEAARPSLPFVTGEAVDPVEAEELALMPAPVGLMVQGVGFAAADGVPLHVSTGLLGCGYMPTGSATATFAGGSFIVDVPQDIEGYGSPSVFVWADFDGDGVCDTSKGDGLWSMWTEVSETPAFVTMELGTESVMEGSWECLLFQQP